MPACAPPTSLRFEHRTDAGPVLGIGVSTPRLSWVVPNAEAGFVQRAYEVEVTRASGIESFAVDSAEQVLVPWPGRPLGSRERAGLRIRVSDDSWSEWSEPALVEAGLLRPEEWAARFVSPQSLGRVGMAAPRLHGTLDVPGKVATARLYVTAHGVHSVSLNGKPASDDILAPGWTSYSHRLRYQTYDVTDLIKEGENTLDAVLGNGWFRGRLGWGGRRALYGDRLALLAQLEVTTIDGARHVLATDDRWSAYESPILVDDLYDGQTTDLRTHRAEQDADSVEVLPASLERLVAPDGPPVRVTDTLPAIKTWTSPAGETLIDFGQNVVGWVRLRVRGLAEGREVVVRHAEVLEHGELGVRPLRTAVATDRYILAGSGEEVLEPSVTFHGFRYVQVNGCAPADILDVDAVVVGSDLMRTGWFTCSSDLVSRLHENVVWGMKGNFLDVPTDCPQRDERLGWTGDIQVFSPSASFLFDCAGFLASWLKDLAAEQRPDGSVPFVVPDVLGETTPAAAAWGDAATVVPWVLYQRFGDIEILRGQFSSMRRWTDCIGKLAGSNRLWSGGFQFGDWLDATAPPDNPFKAQVNPDVLATAHLVRSAQIVADTATVLGEDEVAREYQSLADSARAAFQAEYVSANGRIVSDAPTAYAMALSWALLPTEEQRTHGGDRLADLVRVSGFRISTGFVGTPLIADALTATGHVDVAYRLLLQTGVPSWLYAVSMGATTVWERWDSMLPDGSINPGEMTSFNHYALGAVADWLHRTVAGLAPAEPGYRRLVIRPELGGRLTAAAARHLTPYGEAGVEWQRDGGRFSVTVTIPVGVIAEVHLPGSEEPITAGHGRHTWEGSLAETTPTPPGTVRQLMDDEARWDRVVAAAVESGVAGSETDVAERLTAYLDSDVAPLTRYLTVDGMIAGGERLGELVAPVLSD